ncbi:MAG: hypothetical protein M3R69_06685 [Acidobacteriota bacterium]|nr:hypothetical protein [Acidobacteriota bacterium]
MEDPLPKLQKVGDELAANSGHRSCSIARALVAREISLVGLESADRRIRVQQKVQKKSWEE